MSDGKQVDLEMRLDECRLVSRIVFKGTKEGSNTPREVGYLFAMAKVLASQATEASEPTT